MHIYLHTHANCVLVPLMYTSSHQSQADANDFKLSIQLAIRGSLPLLLACHCSCTYGMWSLCSVEALELGQGISLTAYLFRINASHSAGKVASGDHEQVYIHRCIVTDSKTKCHDL